MFRRRAPVPRPASADGPTDGSSTPGAAPNGGPLGYELLTTDDFVRLIYNVLLQREPDQGAWDLYLPLIGDGGMDRLTLVDQLRSSVEYFIRVRPRNLLVSMHLSRCAFVQGFPRAARILDLGGTHQSDPNGAMVSMGYPFAFDELVIVDLPFEMRHDIYTHSAPITEQQSPLGPVRYRYHSMADLSPYPDGSFDLVYSGQTIEHVTEEECDVVLSEVMRVLRPGGWFCLDTPNGPVCRLQQAAFINPDHKVEYSHAELSAKLAAAGFEIRTAKGLNWVGPAYTLGVFDTATTAHYVGIYGVPEECYLLAYECQKPA